METEYSDSDADSVGTDERNHESLQCSIAVEDVLPESEKTKSLKNSLNSWIEHYQKLSVHATRPQIRAATEKIIEKSNKLRVHMQELVVLGEKKNRENCTRMVEQYNELCFHSDVQISCKGNAVQAVAKQLEECSDVFKKMFAHNMLESKSCSINFNRFESEAVQILIHFCASRKFVKLDCKIVRPTIFLDLAIMAGELSLPELLSRATYSNAPWEIDLELFRLSGLHCTQHPSPHTKWKELHKTSKDNLSQIITETDAHPLIGVLQADELFELSESKKVFEARLNNEIDERINVPSFQADLKLYAVMRSEETNETEEKQILYYRSGIFGYSGCSFQIVLVNDTEDVTSTNFVPVLKMVTPPKIGGVDIPARKIRFRIFKKHGKSVSPLSKVKEECSASSAIMSPTWGKKLFCFPFIAMEDISEDDAAIWCAELLSKQCSSGLKFNELCEEFYIQIDGRNRLLDILVSWANQKQGPFRDIFEAWKYLNEKKTISQSVKDSLRQEFIRFVSESFECHVPFQPTLSCIDRETLGEILSNNRLFVSSEAATLQALMQWAKLPRKVSTEELNCLLKNKHKVWGCIKDSHSINVFGTLQSVKFLPGKGLFLHIEIMGNTQKHHLKNVVLYKDIDRLLPLVRFPFITKEMLYAECAKDDVDFLKQLSVGVELLSEASYIQLTPDKRKLESMECINTSLKVDISDCQKRGECRSPSKYAVINHQYIQVCTECTCERELNLLRKKSTPVWKFHNPFCTIQLKSFG